MFSHHKNSQLANIITIYWAKIYWVKLAGLQEERIATALRGHLWANIRKQVLTGKQDPHVKLCTEGTFFLTLNLLF